MHSLINVGLAQYIMAKELTVHADTVHKTGYSMCMCIQKRLTCPEGLREGDKENHWLYISMCCERC